jgi:hypothetical protein
MLRNSAKISSHHVGAVWFSFSPCLALLYLVGTETEILAQAGEPKWLSHMSKSNLASMGIEALTQDNQTCRLVGYPCLARQNSP